MKYLKWAYVVGFPFVLYGLAWWGAMGAELLLARIVCKAIVFLASVFIFVCLCFAWCVFADELVGL